MNTYDIEQKEFMPKCIKDTIQIINSMKKNLELKKNVITNQALLLEYVFDLLQNEIDNTELTEELCESKDDFLVYSRKAFAKSILTKVENWEGNKNDK